MAEKQKLNKDDLLFICRKLKENKNNSIIDNKLVIKINYYKSS